MPISESQLDTWSRQGATQSAATLYQRIKTALETAPELSGKSVDIYLQGSYRNDTNIRGDSDVDVVAELQSTFMSNGTELPSPQDFLYNNAYQPATYSLSAFRSDVDKVLRRCFPAHQITQGGKSIKIPRGTNNVPADVVPCLTYRRYSAFVAIGHPSTHCVEGIWLWDTKKSVAVIGYPKQHYSNGVLKHQGTNSWFKPTIRVYKNLRCWMEDNAVIPKGLASSNHIECLLCNVPNSQFGISHEDTFVNSVNWLSTTDISKFACIHGQSYLFDSGQWSQDQARQFLGAAIRTWNTWGQNALLRVR